MDEPAAFPGDTYDLCVIGAGVSGLCLARLAATRLNLRVLLLEKRSEAGGCLASAPVAEGGWLELGAHTCYNSYARFLDLAAGTPFLTRVVARKKLSFRLVEGGVPRSILSCLDYVELACSLPRLIGASRRGHTAQAFFSRILGRGNWARVLHPSLNAVASQETAGFPADALFKSRPRRRKDVARSFALRGGLGPAVQTLGDHPLIQRALDREATAVTLGPHGEYLVHTAQGEVCTARRVALAVPAQAAAGLVAGSFPALAGQLGRMETKVVRSLGVVFRNPLAHLPRLAGLILTDGPCFSAVSADTFPVPGKRAWTFHFDGSRVSGTADMVGYACQVLGASAGDLEASYRKDHAMPAITMEHGAWLESLDLTLRDMDLMVVGNYLTGLSIEDCAGRALEEFERVLLKGR
jgi:protoporphyrinogen oxidase